MPEGSPIPGRFSFRITPYLVEPLDCISDARVTRVVFRKSAQIGWTEGVVLNYVGYKIDSDPSRMLILFPREKTAVEFNDEKLEPMIQGCRALRDKVNLTSRAAGNRQLFKRYPGGFLKLIASNAPGDVKSTSAPLVFVEEPDDCNQNVKGQGDSIKLAEERAKAYHNAKTVIGGTPTIEEISAIDDQFNHSDRRYYFVPCHECGHAAPLEWDHVRWVKDEANPHPVFGKHHPETARYQCPSCHAMWDDAQKNRNVRRAAAPEFRGKAGWIATAPFFGVAGFHANELVSPFPKSAMSILAEKYLHAVAKAKAGDFDDLVAFYNSSLAKSWAQQSTAPKEDVLRGRAEEYDEFTVPAGGVMLTMGVDVQHDRLAIMVWAFGLGEESWLVFWGEIHGNTVDIRDPVWEEADRFLLRAYAHASGAEIFVEACTIDASDGQTSDAVYAWVRKHKAAGRRVMAGKGASERAGDTKREVYAVPSGSIDAATPTKASKYGLRVHLVGTQRAKDLILGSDEGAGRLNLAGSGPGRMHWYRQVRDDFYSQITSEVKVQRRGTGKRKVWEKKAGRANEGLDATILALHAARSLNSHRLDARQWAAREARLRQADLLAAAAASGPTVRVAQQPGNNTLMNVLASQLNKGIDAPAALSDEPRPW